jgi:hypothetical protein
VDESAVAARVHCPHGLVRDDLQPGHRAGAHFARAARGRGHRPGRLHPGQQDSGLFAFHHRQRLFRNKQTFSRFAELADYSSETRAAIGRVVADFAESGLALRR